MPEHLKVNIFVPAEYVEPMVEALNEAGMLGSDDKYDFVYNLTPIKGYFRPLAQADNFSGKKGEVSEVDEVILSFRIEKSADHKQKLRDIIKEYHPYEVPVVELMPLIDITG